MADCKQCSYIVSDYYARDCVFPDCIGGWEAAYKNLISKNLVIKSVTVLLTHGTDLVTIDLIQELPSPIFPFNEGKFNLTFHAAKGTGEDYVRKNFGIEPKVVNTVPVNE